MVWKSLCQITSDNNRWLKFSVFNTSIAPSLRCSSCRAVLRSISDLLLNLSIARQWSVSLAYSILLCGTQTTAVLLSFYQPSRPHFWDLEAFLHYTIFSSTCVYKRGKLTVSTHFSYLTDIRERIAQGTISCVAIYNNGSVKNDQNQNICLAFTVDDIEKAHKRVLAMGARIIEGPTKRPWGAINMSFYDPDNNMVFFRSFPQNS